MRAVLVLLILTAAQAATADPLPPDPFEAATTDASMMHSRSYRESRNADDLRDISSKRKMILDKCRVDRVRNGYAALNDICRYHLSLAEKHSPGIWRGISECGPKRKVCID